MGPELVQVWVRAQVPEQVPELGLEPLLEPGVLQERLRTLHLNWLGLLGLRARVLGWQVWPASPALRAVPACLAALARPCQSP